MNGRIALPIHIKVHKQRDKTEEKKYEIHSN